MSSGTATYPVIKGTLVSTQNYTWNTADSLGRGASAVVYLGRHNIKGTLVAVKVFHQNITMGYSEDDRELMLLRKLNHPNIISLLGIEKQSVTNKCVLILEYCEGASLHHMLDTPTHFYGLHESEFLRVLTHVCAGIEYLRQEKVVHRDIKPGNIMRYIDDEGLSIYKLTDFGAARDLGESECFQSLYGTEEYLHPAIFEKAILRMPTAHTFTANVDLWSLGVTFYHTATGQLPFQPYGGRNNRHTMFDMTSQKESGVISGIQRTEHGSIEWKSDLPATSPLTSGLRSILIPLLAGLMEPNDCNMITYDAMFRIVKNIEKKVTISMFHYSCCEQLVIYADPNTTLMGLKDEITSLTDIPIVDQILLVGGELLDKVINPLACVSTYPDSVTQSRIYIFQRDMHEHPRLTKPDIPPFPTFPPYANIDEDAKLAHACAARGELIKRYVEKVSSNQLMLVDGLMYLRIYIEKRLAETRISHDFMMQLMEDYKQHYSAFIQLANFCRDCCLNTDMLSSRGTEGSAKVHESHPHLHKLNGMLQDTAMGEVQSKASDRINEIQQYSSQLRKRIEDIKLVANQYSAVCHKENCLKKVKHYLGQITSIQSRFRRDRTVKLQLTDHDQNIHGFERHKLEVQCDKLKSIIMQHCLPHQETLFVNGLRLSEPLSKCLQRVHKIEKNINSVLNCLKSLTEKLLKQQHYACTVSLKTPQESGYVSDRRLVDSNQHQEATGPMNQPEEFMETGIKSLSEGAKKLGAKLDDLQEMLSTNSALLQGLDETPMQSSNSLNQGIEQMYIDSSTTS